MVETKSARVLVDCSLFQTVVVGLIALTWWRLAGSVSRRVDGVLAGPIMIGILPVEGTEGDFQ